MKTVLLAITLLQTPSAQGAYGMIEGIILDADAKPIFGAHVRAFWSPAPQRYDPTNVPAALSEADGTFRIQNLSAGGYVVHVTAPGYVYQQYGAEPGRGQRGNVLMVNPGATTSGIVMRLTRDAVISGRVSTTTGEPLVRMDIWAMRRMFDASGFVFLSSESRTETDDRGEYRLNDLPAGSYYIRAAPQNSSRIESEIRQAEREGRRPPARPTAGSFAAILYPGAIDLSKATPIAIAPGSEAGNIDIVLPREPTFTIRGIIKGLSDSEQPREKARNEPATHVTVSIMPLRENFAGGSGGSWNAYQSDGSFELANVAPGYYRLIVTPPLPRQPDSVRQLQRTPGVDRSLLPGPPPQGVAYVQVVNADVNNVEVTIVRGLSVVGRLNMDDGASIPPGLKVELRFVESSGRTASVSGQVTTNNDGRFAYSGIAPAEYRLTMSGVPADFYIREASLGNIDALTDPLVLTSTPVDTLNIILSRGRGVSGDVTSIAGVPVPGQQVVLIPESTRNRADLYKTATTDANGRFFMQGVAPGDYRAFAWQPADAFRYFDREFVRTIENNGVSVQVSSDSDTTIRVTSMRPPQ